jgi:hypothetical protein
MPLLPKRLHVDVDLGGPSGSIGIYRTARGRASSDELRQDLVRRWGHWREVFSIDGDPADLGDRMAYLDASTALEVYLASDSIWWTDRSNAYREEPGESAVPDEDEAVRLARRFIETTFEPVPGLRDVMVGVQVASISPGRDDQPRSQRVGLAVTLRPTLADRPVFGPGAKVRVTFTQAAVPSDVAFFSRPSEPDGEVEAVHPYRALERLSRDRRFVDVLTAGLEIHVRRFEWGYYSAPPNMFQRYLVPVYLAEGVVEGADLEADVFRLYLPAVDVDARSMKELGVRANPTVVSSFTSF